MVGVHMVLVLGLLLGKLAGIIVTVVVVFSALVVSIEEVVGTDFCGVVSFKGECWVLAVNELKQWICLSIYKTFFETNVSESGQVSAKLRHMFAWA